MRGRRIRTSFLHGGGILIRKIALFGGAAILAFAAFAPAATAATPPVDNTAGHASCGTVSKGVIKPKPTLTNAGGVPTVLAVSGTLGGCSSGDVAVTFPEGKSKFKGSISSADNGCAGLSGASTSTGTITISWGTTPAVSNKSTVVTIPSGSSVGGFGVFAGDLHGTFTLGAPEGAALSATGGFLGGDGGASSHASVITQESVPTILAGCADVKGLKQINIGVAGLVSG